MLYIGSHLSISKGYEAIAKQAHSIGANTFAYFTRNPRGGKARKLDIEDMERMNTFLKEHHFGPLVAHAPYTLNGASNTEKTKEFAKLAMKEDLERMEYTPGHYYNFHPGSHVKQGAEKGIDKIVNMLNTVLWEEQKTMVLLESMAGKGTEVGRNFEELQEIISRVNYPHLVGVCLDTCHVNDGGYDIVNDLDGVLKEFDEIIGLDKLMALHLNDSKNERGAAKDRHEKIGEGTLGLSTFENIVNHPVLEKLPMILETPNEIEGYEKEIALLRGLKK